MNSTSCSVAAFHTMQSLAVNAEQKQENLSSQIRLVETYLVLPLWSMSVL